MYFPEDVIKRISKHMLIVTCLLVIAMSLPIIALNIYSFGVISNPWNSVDCDVVEIVGKFTNYTFEYYVNTSSRLYIAVGYGDNYLTNYTYYCSNISGVIVLSDENGRSFLLESVIGVTSTYIIVGISISLIILFSRIKCAKKDTYSSIE